MLELVALRARPDLMPWVFSGAMQAAWPEFMQHDPGGATLFRQAPPRRLPRHRLRGRRSGPARGGRRPDFRRAFGVRDARVAAGAESRYCSLSSDQLGGEEETAMPTYIAFGNWTDQGVRAIAESPQRLDAAKRQLEDMAAVSSASG
jgi:hypothetical protein